MKIKTILIILEVGFLVLSGFGVAAITNNKATSITNSLATTDNHPPYAPNNYYPCGELDIDVNVNLSWDGGDPDLGDTVTYTVFFGTDPLYLPPIAIIGPYPWNQTRIDYDPGTLEYCTKYYMMIAAHDNHNASTIGYTCYFITNCENHPPSAPTITGPIIGKVGIEYIFRFNAIDPDNDDVKYEIQWGDGNEEVTDFYSSGIDVMVKHVWKKIGTYIIMARAQDEHGSYSTWATPPIPITITKNKDKTISTPIQTFIQHYSTDGNQQSFSIPIKQNFMSFVPSIENIIEDTPASSFIKNADDCSIEILSNGTILYAFIYGGPNGTGFYAFSHNEIVRFHEWKGDPSFTSGTWTNDGRWFCIYSGRILYEVNPETLDVWGIGGGGVSLRGLSYDPVTEKLYGTSSQALYEIDMETGEQEFIGYFNVTEAMEAIAFDSDGILYGWASYPDNLYTINTSTGEATTVGPLGININYAYDGSFDFETDNLYFTAYILSPSWGYYWISCDEDTGGCSIGGHPDGYYYVLAISYETDTTPPATNISFDPPEPDGLNGFYVSNVTVTFNATDDISGVNVTYYRINEGEWEIYVEPFKLENNGFYQIEFYSVDNTGNIESPKLSYLKIDQTPPEISAKWEVNKKDGKWIVTIIINYYDNESGIERLDIYMNHELEETIIGPGPTCGFSIEWFKEIKGFVFTYIAYNFAGLSAFALVNGSDIKSYPSGQNSQQSYSIPISQKTMCVVPSTENILENNLDCSHILNAVYSSKKLSVRGHIAYGYISYDPSGQLGAGPAKFELDNPGNLTKLSGYTVNNFFTGGTWTRDGRWLCVKYGTDMLYEINPDDGHITEIGGGGGDNISDLAYDPFTCKMYGVGDTYLYLIDTETGELTIVGIGSYYMVGLAFDRDGICYGIGLNGLYTIDVSTGEVTFVCPLINCTSPSDAEFDIDNDILYLIGYTTGYMTGLYICDTETGECDFVGQFEGGVELTALAIPYNSSFIPPITTISFDPPKPDGCNGWYISNVTVILNAIDQDGVNATYYRINNGTWATYETPFVISEEGDDILIEFYSVDIYGNIENVKSETLDIDRTPPNMTVEWEVKRIGWRKWQVTFSINITNEPSGMNRIEIYINDVLQETIVGPGPIYTWSLIICYVPKLTLKFLTWDQACNQAIVIVNGSDIKSYSSSQISQQSSSLPNSQDTMNIIKNPQEYHWF
jgi:hypothetical protein